jgi:hypothetical protein
MITSNVPVGFGIMVIIIPEDSIRLLGKSRSRDTKGSCKVQNHCILQASSGDQPAASHTIPRKGQPHMFHKLPLNFGIAWHSGTASPGRTGRTGRTGQFLTKNPNTRLIFPYAEKEIMFTLVNLDILS